MTYKVVNISDSGTSIKFGADDTDKLAYAARGQPYKYIVFIDTADSNKIKCFDNEGGTVVQTHSTDAKIPIQYAVDNADGKPILIKGGNYNLASGLDLKNTYWTIHGEKGGNDYQQNIGQTVLIKNYTSTSGNIFLDAGGDPFWYGDLRHIVLSGDGEGIGLKYIHNLRTLEDSFIYNFRTGLHITDPVYANVYNLVIENCLDYGVYIINADTIYFYGGRIKGNGTNVFLDDGETCGFYGTNLEHGVNYGVYLNSNTSAAQPNSCFFNDCALETWSDTLTAVIYDEGRANTYNKCKISSDNTDFTLINVGANARSIEFNNCLFKANTSSTTARITIDSGAQGIRFLFNNTHSGGQITSLVFTDNGTDTLCLGNAGTPTLSNQFPIEINNRRTIPIFNTDCWGTGTASVSPYSLTLISSATASAPTAEAEHPGIVKATSSTSADSGVNLAMSNNGILLQGGEQFECIMRFSSFTNNTFRIGFGDTTTVSDNVDGVYFEISGSSTISAKTANSSTRTTNANTYTASTATWYHFKINVISPSLVRFLIYSDAGVELYNRTNTANIPTGAGRACGSQVIGTNSTTTGSIDLYEIDYIAVATGGLNPLQRGLRSL